MFNSRGRRLNMGRHKKHPICSFEIKVSPTQDLVRSFVCKVCGRIGLIDDQSIKDYIRYTTKTQESQS